MARASRPTCATASSTASCAARATARAWAAAASGCRSFAPWRSRTAGASSWGRATRAVRASWRASRSRRRPGLHLHDHRKYHWPAPEPVVDEPRDVVVQVVLEHVDLADLLLGGVRERVVDRGPDLVEHCST